MKILTSTFWQNWTFFNSLGWARLCSTNMVILTKGIIAAIIATVVFLYFMITTLYVIIPPSACENDLGKAINIRYDLLVFNILRWLIKNSIGWGLSVVEFLDFENQLPVPTPNNIHVHKRNKSQKLCVVLSLLVLLHSTNVLNSEQKIWEVN